MSEEPEIYEVNLRYKRETLWLARRLKDIVEDLKNLSDEEKKNLIEIVNNLDSKAIESLNKFIRNTHD